MTRAWFSVFRLDFRAAFFYHPLFMLPIPAALLLLFRQRLPKKFYSCSWHFIIGLFTAVYILRLIDPGNTVVVFTPTEGFVYKAIKLITN